MSDETFDVFLSHNSRDKPAVRDLGQRLRDVGLQVWLDEWELVPGRSWQEALEDIIATCRSAAVCVGPNGIGPWEEPEMRALLNRFMKERATGKAASVIPVLLPGAPSDVTLPMFLETFTWVDFRDGFNQEGLGRMEWGITGTKPTGTRQRKETPKPTGAADSIESLLEEFPLPRVDELSPYDVLHVARTEMVKEYALRGEVPPYVPRDVDGKLDEVVKPSRFVVIVGPSRWGKTRTAYEAMKRSIPDARVVIPKRPGGEGVLPSILQWCESTDHTGPLVLWLDDLQRFLNGQALTLRQVRHVLTKPLLLLGTIRSEEYSPLARESSQVGKPSREVLDFADVIEVSKMSASERDKASGVYPEHDFRGEIGETFLGAPALLKKYNHGAAECPSGAAIVHAVADWRRVGVERPLCEALLRNVVEHYYRQVVPHGKLTESLINDGVEWATDPVERQYCLLEENASDDGGRAFTIDDMLVKYREMSAAEIHPEMWSLAIKHLETNGDELFNIGYRAYVRDFRNYAEDGWRAAAKVGVGPAAYNLGDLLRENGDEAGAEEAYRRGMELGVGRSALMLGNLLRKKRDSDGAVEAYQSGMELNVPEAAFNLGKLLAERRDTLGAEEAYRKAVRLGYGVAALNLGNLRKKEGDKSGAEEAYRSGMDLGSAKAAYNLGVSLSERGDKAGAEETYRKAMELGEVRAAHSLGVLLNEKGDKVGAEREYRRAVELGSGEAAHNLGNLLNEKGDKTGAEDAFRRALQLGVGESALNLGNLLNEEGDKAGAEREYRKAIELGHGKAAHNLGVHLNETGDKAGAEDAFRRGMELGVARAALNLGNLLNEKGDKAGAEDAFRGGMKLSHGGAAYNLGNLLREKNDITGAEQAFRIGMKLGIDEAAHNLGLLLYHKGDKVGSEQAFRRAEELGFSGG